VVFRGSKDFTARADVTLARHSGVTVPRLLIVNADDFGQSAGINRGIVEAFENGIVTSASLMVSWPASAGAAAFARGSRALAVGLHVDLGEWIYRDGRWTALYERVSPADADAVEKEVRSQLERCCDLLGRPPTHLDSHQHVHQKQPARSILIRIAAELHVPLRHFAPSIHYCGDFYGQTAEGAPLPDRIGTAALVTLLHGLPEGLTELGCHPGYSDGLETMYGRERSVELGTLCHHDVRQALLDADIRVVSFAHTEVN
jgi:predicted glycoside hydrolase/deacetylase ChbG (UPF0249 family)